MTRCPCLGCQFLNYDKKNCPECEDCEARLEYVAAIRSGDNVVISPPDFKKKKPAPKIAKYGNLYFRPGDDVAVNMAGRSRPPIIKDLLGSLNIGQVFSWKVTSKGRIYDVAKNLHIQLRGKMVDDTLMRFERVA